MYVSTPTLTRSLGLRDVTGGVDAADAPHCDATAVRTLADLPRGATATVRGVCDQARPEVARRLFDLGFAPGTEVTRLRQAPLGDPIVVRVADYELALRRAQARCIRLDAADDTAADARTSATASTSADAPR